jgi:F0F1-type ATP synthase epsilon subunit
MSTPIKLKIYMPERVVVEKDVYRVVLPNNGSMLTVIEGRTPTLLALDRGLLRILDENNQVIEEYFVSTGAADIKNDTCTVLTEAAINRKDITLEQAKEMYAEYNNPFSKWLITQLEQKAE